MALGAKRGSVLSLMRRQGITLVLVGLGSADMVGATAAIVRSTLIGAGKHLIILDKDGNLALATPDDKG